ncbi:type II restriction enzyme, partial [Thermoproteota archaeon]
MASDKSWSKIVKDYNILRHDFLKCPFLISAQQIKNSCQNFKKTNEKEVRILCKQDTRESRPKIFR